MANLIPSLWTQARDNSVALCCKNKKTGNSCLLDIGVGHSIKPSGIILLPKENVSASSGLFFIFDFKNDHHALKWAFFLWNAEGRLAKWRLRLAEFDFDVVYRPGVKHKVPEALSRIETTGGESGPLDDSIPCP